MSWKVKSLQDVCEKITDGTHQTPTYFPDGIVFLSSKNVTTGKIDWENIKYIDEAQHLELHKRVAPKIGDILLAKNGTTGVAAIVDRDIVFDIYVSLAWLRPKGEITSEYLLQFINSPLAKKQFNSRLKGIGVPNLHLKEIKEVKIPIPPLSEQQAIVEKLDAAFALIDQAKANIEKNIQNAKELFQSKLNQIFSQKGEGWEERKLGEIGKVCMCKRIMKHQTDPDGEIPFYKIGTFGKAADAFISNEIYLDFKKKYSYPKKG
ncbi:MAG: restriction endonuclease subunit S, partial [Weeksellaceae bacterium]|nr:restriction endonuclease subunit S [Weeksellaceae bacterium]